MKKRFLTLIACCAAVCTAMADSHNSNQAFGIQLGYSQPSLREPKTLPSTTDVSNKTLYKGFNAGLVYEGTIVKGFGTYFALNYTFGADINKWSSIYTNQSHPQKRDSKFYHSVSLRSDWQYKFTIAKETYLLLYTGPVIGINIDMKDKSETEILNPQTLKYDIQTTYVNRLKDNYQDSNPQLLRYNIQWGIGAGFQYQRYYIRGGYDFGITNEYKYKYQKTVVEDGVTQTLEMRNRCRLDNWHVSLGVYLWESDKH